MIADLFHGPALMLLNDLPPGTRYAFIEDGKLLHWDAIRDQYTIAMSTPLGGGHWCYTIEPIAAAQVKQVRAHGDSFTVLLRTAFLRLQMRHYFNLVYDRGGYC